MSYNSRRGGFGPHSLSQVGQRRPGPHQHMGNQGQMPHTPQGRGRPEPFAAKQNQPPPSTQNQRQQNLRQQAEKYLQQQQPPPPNPEPKPIPEPKPVELKPEPMVVEAVKPTNGTNEKEVPDEGAPVTTEEGEKTRKAKPHWVKGSGKINRKELRRRRNLRLRKILQPKNALMVLNELIGGTTYEVSDTPDMFSGTLFKCTVVVDGVEHVGLGKSKPSAKNAAAEAALKHMVLNKVTIAPPPDNSIKQEGDASEIKMDIDDNSEGISWSHVACYALHKLLNSWDDGTNLNVTEKATPGGNTDAADGSKVAEKKPAKKLPNNANTMNPVMLLNQMLPNATFEEMSREGKPPNVNFTAKCTIGNDQFFGTASTKKGSRKICAFAACQNVLNIQYTPAFLEEQGFSEDAVKVVLGGGTAQAV